MTAGIVIDRWKLSIFERYLSQAGYSWDKADLAEDTVLLKVQTEDEEALARLVNAINLRAAFIGNFE